MEIPVLQSLLSVKAVFQRLNYLEQSLSIKYIIFNEMLQPLSPDICDINYCFKATITCHSYSTNVFSRILFNATIIDKNFEHYI